MGIFIKGPSLDWLHLPDLVKATRRGCSCWHSGLYVVELEVNIRFYLPIREIKAVIDLSACPSQKPT